MKEYNQLGFLLRNIKTEQFAILEENCNQSGSDDVKLHTTINFRIDNSNRMVGIFVGFVFDQDGKPFIKIDVSCHFDIEPGSWESFKNEENNKIIIPHGFLAHLSAISVGTVRGVLFAKTEGTKFNKFIVPTLNVAEMIKQDAEFDI